MQMKHIEAQNASTHPICFSSGALRSLHEPPLCSVMKAVRLRALFVQLVPGRAGRNMGKLQKSKTYEGKERMCLENVCKNKRALAKLLLKVCCWPPQLFFNNVPFSWHLLSFLSCASCDPSVNPPASLSHLCARFRTSISSFWNLQCSMCPFFGIPFHLLWHWHLSWQVCLFTISPHRIALPLNSLLHESSARLPRRVLMYCDCIACFRCWMNGVFVLLC